MAIHPFFGISPRDFSLRKYVQSSFDKHWENTQCGEEMQQKTLEFQHLGNF